MSLHLIDTIFLWCYLNFKYTAKGSQNEVEVLITYNFFEIYDTNSS